MRENSDDDEEVTNDGTDCDSCDDDNPETITPGIHPSRFLNTEPGNTAHVYQKVVVVVHLIITCGRERKGWGPGKGLL